MTGVLGLYLPGRSPLHRAPAAVKLGALFVVGIAVLWLNSLWQLGIAALCAVGLVALARVPGKVAFTQIRPVLWFAVPLFAVQWATSGVTRAGLVVGQLIVLVLLASLVTLTTRVLDMVDTFERGLRPFARFGVPPDRVALVLALAIRCVPLVAQTYDQSRQAQRARGMEHSPLALAVPLVVRLLKRADAIGEALAARGVDD